MRAAASRLPNPVPDNGRDGGYYCGQNPNNSWCTRHPASETYTVPTDGKPFVMGPSGSCGTVKFCNLTASCTVAGDPKKSGPDSMKCKSCQAQIDFMNTTVIPTFSLVADAYIAHDFVYTQYYSGSLEASGIKIDKDKDLKKKDPKEKAKDEDSEESSIITLPPKPQPAVPPFVQAYCSAESVIPCIATSLPKANSEGTYMSASNDVIKEIYWPYGLKPYFKNVFKGDGSGSGDEDNIVSQTVKAYSEKLQKLADENVEEKKKEPINKLFEQAKANGWILAGSYYHMLANANKSNSSDSMPKFSTVEPRAEEIAISNDSPLYRYRNNYNAAKSLMGIVAGGGGDDQGASGAASGAAADGTADALGGFHTLISGFGGPNPLVQVIQFGLSLMDIAFATFLAFVIIMLILSIVSNIMVMIIGSGLTDNPLGKGMVGIIIILYPIFLFFVGTLISVGALLGIYVPLIPFVLFTMGGVGWMINVVEAMVAGPLVALGILSPSGHHELLGKAEPALGMLFALFLRPSLMIFGMITAMLTSVVAVMLVNAGFHNVLTTMYDFGGQGASAATARVNSNPIVLLMMLVAYVSLIISVLNKCFSAIHIIPERVMGWIGLQGAQYGEAEALGGMKGGLDAAGGQAAATMGKVQPKFDGAAGGDARAAANYMKTKTPVQPGKGGEGPSLPGQDGNHPSKKG
jgi:hypothetical protein